jgi:hypothetical protein
MSRSFPGRVLVAFLTLACAHAVARGQATAIQTPSRETQWQEDLDMGAVLIGEPTGEKLDSYGEVLQLTLPHSQLSVQYTTKLFRLSRSGDPIALFPDLTVTRSLDDALAGRDPALDAALRYQGR